MSCRYIKDMSDFPDDELFEQYRSGAIQSFEALYERYKAAVYQLILEHTDSAYEAGQILQRIFFKVHTLRSLINRKHQFSQWLFVISLSEINRALNDSPMVSFSESIESLQLLEPQKIKKASDFSSHLRETFSALSDEELKLLHMRFIDGLAFEEIAQELGISSDE